MDRGDNNDNSYYSGVVADADSGADGADDDYCCCYCTQLNK